MKKTAKTYIEALARVKACFEEARSLKWEFGSRGFAESIIATSCQEAHGIIERLDISREEIGACYVEKDTID